MIPHTQGRAASETPLTGCPFLPRRTLRSATEGRSPDVGCSGLVLHSFMKITIASEIKGAVEIEGQFDDFFLWVAANRTDERLKSLLILLAEHDRETDEEERTNIRRTLDEILANK